MRVGEQNVSCTLVILEEGSAEGHGRPQGIPIRGHGVLTGKRQSEKGAWAHT